MGLIEIILKFFGYVKNDADHKPNMKYYDDQLKSLNKSHQNEIESLKVLHFKDLDHRNNRYESEINNIKSRLEKEFELNINKRIELQYNEWKVKGEKSIREDAISRSKSVITGQITEHFAPYHPDFKYNPKDARFLGSPIDLIIYNGLYDNGDVKNIIFMEIKTGKSQMSSKQRSIKKCVESGNIIFEEFRIIEETK